MAHKAHEEHAHSGYRIYLVTWLALLVMTALTVGVAGMRLGGFSVPIAILIAAIKASVVTLYFMHMRSESLTLKVMVIVCFVTFAIFVGLTFTDYPFRLK